MAVASTTICVANLPSGLTDREFKLMFKFAPGYERACICNSTPNRNIGYARFSSVQQANDAVQFLRGKPFDEYSPAPVTCFLSTTQLDDDFENQNNASASPASFTPLTSTPASAAQPPAAASPTNPLSVYVGGIPPGWDEATLNSLFSQFGTITNVQVTIGKNPEVGNIGFIYFSAPEEAAAAIQRMHNYTADSKRHLVVRPNTSAAGATGGARPPRAPTTMAPALGKRSFAAYAPPAPAPYAYPGYPPAAPSPYPAVAGYPGAYPGAPPVKKARGPANPLSIYVGGIPQDWDENQLIALFVPYGNIVSTQLKAGKNQEVGNIAFIFYSSPEEAEAAVAAMNHYALEGEKHLVVRPNTSAAGKRTA